MIKIATCLMFIAIIFCSVEKISAQNPSLVADINNTPQPPSGFYDWISANNILYVNAKDNSGYRLWRTDGTSGGTYGISPVFMYDNASLNGTVFYEGNDTSSGGELWKSDGTSLGTVLVKDILPGSSGSYPAKLFAANGVVYFQASLPALGTELWKSDGTASGTLLVKDIAQGTAPSNPFYNGEQPGYVAAVELGVRLVFVAYTSGTGHELWITDGTGEGTSMLKDIYSGLSSSIITDLVNYNGTIYFLANDGIHGDALWKTDGTSEGTVLVKDFFPGNKEYTYAMVMANNKLMIVVSDDIHKRGLWVSDGSTDGTSILLNATGVIDVESDDIASFGNKVYFSYNDGVHGYEPWITDGTAGGTVMLANIKAGNSSSNPTVFTPAASRIIFVANYEDLYSTDGTPGGTFPLAPSLPIDFSVVGPFASFLGKVYFSSTSITQPLWTTDGTLEGTQPFQIDVTQNASSNPKQAVKMDAGKYIVTATDSIHGHEVWMADEGSGAVLLNDIYSGPVSPGPQLYPVNVNGLIYFYAISLEGNLQKPGLWRTDGTSQGTISLGDVNVPQIQFKGYGADADGIFYFQVFNISDNELWRSDGTVVGTYKIKDLNPGANDFVGSLASYNGKIYFAANDGIHGVELWQTDGTAVGTVMVKDIRAGSGSSNPSHITSVSDKLYFSANGGATGGELWVSDGTANGTLLLKDINPEVGEGSSPSSFTTSGNYIYFTANDGVHGVELWKTNGTTNGTTLTADLKAGPGSGNPAYLTDVNGTLYFIYKNSLMKTTGNETQVVITIPYPVSLSELVNVSGYLYFNDDYPGFHLWRTDGSACHTQLLDLSPGVPDNVRILLVDGNDLLLNLNSVAFGNELFRYHTMPISSIEICNGIDDDCNGIVDDNALVATITPSGNISACDGELVSLNAAPTGDDLNYNWYYNGNLIGGATTSSLSSSTLGGNVQVMVSSDFGCIDASEATSVNRIVLPNAKITPVNNLDICITGSVILKANSGMGFTYQWLLNNSPIPGATKKQYAATAVGNYKVMVTNGYDCSKISNKATVFTSCKQESQLLNSTSIIAYPNPFHDFTLIDLSHLNLPEEQLTFAITDLSGKILLKKNFSYQDKIEIGGDLPNGFYLLEVKGENQYQLISIVKE